MCEGIQDLATQNGVENLRTHFEPIEVFWRGRIVDDFVYDFAGSTSHRETHGDL